MQELQGTHYLNLFHTSWPPKQLNTIHFHEWILGRIGFFSENQAQRGAARHGRRSIGAGVLRTAKAGVHGRRSIGAGVLRKRQPKRVRRLSALHIVIPSYMFLNCHLPLVVIATHSPVLSWVTILNLNLVIVPVSKISAAKSYGPRYRHQRLFASSFCQVVF